MVFQDLSPKFLTAWRETMKALKERINFFIKKVDILTTPFIGQINDCKEAEKFGGTELILLGSHKGKTGEFTLRISSTDEVYLANMFGADWSKLDHKEVYEIGAIKRDVFHSPKGVDFDVLNITVKPWRK